MRASEEATLQGRLSEQMRARQAAAKRKREAVQNSRRVAGVDDDDDAATAARLAADSGVHCMMHMWLVFE